MGSLLAVLFFFVVIPVGAAFFGVDSRPADVERATRWWPGAR